MPAGISLRPNASARRGFTLVEVLVALTIAGIAVAAGFGALATVQDRSEQARRASTAAMQAAGARALLTDWLRGALPESDELDVRFEGRDAAEQAIPADELGFPTTTPTPTGAPVTFTRLHLDIDPMTPERGLVAEFVGRTTDLPRRMEIDPRVARIEILYLPDVDGEAVWTTSWIGRDDLPRAVELRLAGTPSAPLPDLLTLPIRVALEAAQ